MRLAVLAVLFLLLLPACGETSVPSGCTPVQGFDVQRYLGKWYEIARLENEFEEGMTHCTAEYSLKDDGSLRVLNRGLKEGRWKEAEGRARFLGDSSVGSLKVSFFGPFWGGYHILALDEVDYSWSLVAGPNREYLWILSREPQLAPEVLERLKQRARELEFPVDELIMVDQTPLDRSTGREGPTVLP